jgi:hypothetical protein
MARKNHSRPRSPRASVQPHIDVQRARLFEAHAVVQVTRFAIASKLNGLDESIVINALRVASDLIDGVAAALEVPTTSRRAI